MAALLAADAAAVFGHVLINILVTDGSLGVADALLVERLVQTEVGHDGGDNGIGQQLAALLSFGISVDVKNVVAGDHICPSRLRRDSGLHRRHRQNQRPFRSPPHISAVPRYG